jgi:hypothetical protein
MKPRERKGATTYITAYLQKDMVKYVVDLQKRKNRFEKIINSGFSLAESITIKSSIWTVKKR